MISYQKSDISQACTYWLSLLPAVNVDTFVMLVIGEVFVCETEAIVFAAVLLVALA